MTLFFLGFLAGVVVASAGYVALMFYVASRPGATTEKVGE